MSLLFLTKHKIIIMDVLLVFFQPLGRRVDLEGYYKAIVAPPGI